MSLTDDKVLVRDALVRLNVYTMNDVWSNVSQNTSGSGLSDQITMSLAGCLHFYSVLFTCLPRRMLIPGIKRHRCQQRCVSALHVFGSLKHILKMSVNRVKERLHHLHVYFVQHFSIQAVINTAVTGLGLNLNENFTAD